MSVEDRLADVRDRIARAGSGRPVTVVAVTKGHGFDAVVAAHRAELFDIGENYATDLTEMAAQAAARQLAGLRFHLLGAVQRNKVKGVSPYVDLWHAVDRPAAATAIASHRPAAAVLVQVNLTLLPGRAGCSWDEAPALVREARAAGLDVRGLMGVAGSDEPRSSFRRLAALARDLGLAELSMGMTHDFEVAVEEGATIVRLGTALFGARPGAAQVRR